MSAAANFEVLLMLPFSPFRCSCKQLLFTECPLVAFHCVCRRFNFSPHRVPVVRIPKMVKHNNVVPNLHFHKKYCASSRGPLKVRLTLNQASKKKSRRLKRAAKAARVAPRPVQLLRPAVHCPTQRYNSKTRLGRGFTLEELRGAGLTASYARTVGIAVDPRRTNRSAESLATNVERLKEYKSKLIVFPRKRLNAPKHGDSGPEETSGATQLQGTVLPLAKPKKEIVMEVVTDEMKAVSAFTTMRVARKETKVAGYRIAVENRKKKD